MTAVKKSRQLPKAIFYDSDIKYQCVIKSHKLTSEQPMQQIEDKNYDAVELEPNTFYSQLHITYDPSGYLLEDVLNHKDTKSLYNHHIFKLGKIVNEFYFKRKVSLEEFNKINEQYTKCDLRTFAGGEAYFQTDEQKDKLLCKFNFIVIHIDNEEPLVFAQRRSDD